MAIATVVDNQEKRTLKTCPPDGYVVVRRMTFGEKLKVKAMTSEMVMNIGDKKSGQPAQAQLQVFEEKVAQWEFSNLILEHNLTDSEGKPLNFKNIADINRIRGPVGQEISDIIREINDFEESDETGN